MARGIYHDIFPSCEWYLTNNDIMWWNITFANCRNATLALGAGKISFWNRTEKEKEGSTFHDREEYLSHEPPLISKISVPHTPLDARFQAFTHKNTIAYNVSIFIGNNNIHTNS